MTDNETPTEGALVPGRDRALTWRSEALVRRGLQEAARLDNVAERVGQLVVPFLNYDYDARAAAARAIAELGPNLNIRDPHVAQLVFELVFDLHFLFQRGQAHCHQWGQGVEYFPPDERYEDLLWRALDSLLGPVSDLDDALLRVFVTGDTDARITAAQWLGNRHVYRATTVLQDAVSAATDERLSLALRYALCTVGADNADAFSRELAREVAAMPRSTARTLHLHYMKYLAHDISAETLGYLLAVFDTDETGQNRDLAVDLLEYSSGEAPDGSWGSFRPDARHAKALEHCPRRLLAHMVQVVWQRFLRAVFQSPPQWRVDTNNTGNLRATVEMVKRDLRRSTGTPLSELDSGLSELLLALLHERDRRAIAEKRT